MARKRLVSSLKLKVLEALLSADTVRTRELVELGLAQGIEAEALYIEVLLATYEEVRKERLRGGTSIPGQLLATQIVLGEMGRLNMLFSRRTGRGLHAVVSNVEGDTDMIGARAIADFLLADGWDVDYLGAGAPTDTLVEFIKDRNPHLVILAVTIEQYLPFASRTVKALKLLRPAPKVILSGHAILKQRNLGTRLGADAVAADPVESTAQARKLFSPGSPEEALRVALKTLGKKLQMLRHELRLTQGEIAKAAGLNRAYLSAVEHGKQNLTLSALFKIAYALNVDPKELISSD